MCGLGIETPAPVDISFLKRVPSQFIVASQTQDVGPTPYMFEHSRGLNPKPLDRERRDLTTRPVRSSLEV